MEGVPPGFVTGTVSGRGVPPASPPESSRVAGSLREVSLYQLEILAVLGPVPVDRVRAIESAPCVVPVAGEAQGEAIAWTRSGEGYLTVSEGANPDLHAVQCVP